MSFRYGVIGTGMMGVEHITNILHIEGADVVAYADPFPASRQAAHRLVPDAAEFENHRRLIDSGLCEAVVVATPNHTHAEVLMDLMPTDLHVLVEKPLCTTVEDCRRVIEAARGRDPVTWVGLEYRYMPPVARLIEEVRKGTAGTLRMLAIREHRFPFLDKVEDWNLRTANTGGTMVEKCCHFFDLMNHILGARPVRVMGSGAQDVNRLGLADMLDNAYVIVDYDSGARAMLDLCMFADATFNQEEVVAVGDHGKLEALIPEMVLRVGRRGEHWIGKVEVEQVHDPSIPYQGHHHGSSYLEHLDFIAACRGEREPGVDLEDGLLAVAMGVAAHRSIELGRPVTLDEVL